MAITMRYPILAEAPAHPLGAVQKRLCNDLDIALQGSFGDEVKVKFVDVASEALKKYPKINPYYPGCIYL